ncbi:MAG: YlbF family regulator [Candidatus Pelethousia sp.]|nr:YlbF family regulator [Candidatus Pelethousia sp.]
MIIEKAQELGLALSESAEFCRMMEAKTAMDKNEPIQHMMRDYTQKREDIVSLMEGEEADKAEMMDLSRQLDEIQNALVTHPVFIEMMEAQQGFQALMQQVNRTIAACIGMEDPDLSQAQSGCNGSCASCAGCKH